MSSLTSPENYHGTLSNQLLGYRCDTSIIGVPIPLLGGTNRLATNALCVFNWQSQPASGGKFGNKGGKLGTNQNYNYTMGAICALCIGPINGILRIWNNTTLMIVSKSFATYTVPMGGGSYTPPAGLYQTFALDQGVYKNAPFSVSVNDYGSPGPSTLSGTQQVPAQRVSGTPGAGQYSVNPTTGVYTFSAADAGVVWQIGYWFVQGNPTEPGSEPLGTLALTLFTGEQGQTKWAGLDTFAVPQIGYSEIAYVANQAWQLGNTPTLPNLSYEVSGPFQFGGGVVDCDPTVWITYLLTNRNGANIPDSILGPVAQMQNYCLANGLFISPICDSQQTYSEYLKEYLLIGNSEIISSEGLLKFCCYSEKSAVGNGVQYTPATQPIYDLDLSDFIVSGPNEAPVTFSVLPAQDVQNRYSIEWCDRGNEYNYSTYLIEDADSVERYGPNTTASVSAHSVCQLSIAAQVASVQMQRSVYMLRHCSFTLGWRHSLLEPMDVVTVPEQWPSTNRLAVRFLEISEDDNGNLSCKGEILLYGISAPTKYPGYTPGSPATGINALPGTANDPIFFEPPAAMNLGQVLLISLSGASVNWGGCTVYVSHDGGNTYVSLGSSQHKSNMGFTTAGFNWGTDPDMTNLISVTLQESLGTLSSVAKSVTDAFKNICLIESELISFEYASLTSSNQYNLESGSSQIYLRRGCYGTPVSAHASGALFTMVDGNQFPYIYTDEEVGHTLYFKFTSFNTAGQQEESLTNVTAYPYRIHLPRPPYPLHALTAEVTSPLFSGVQDPLYPSNNSFAAKQIYIPVGSASTPAVDLVATPPVNSYSIDTVPPIVELDALFTTGGSLTPGTYFIGVTVLGTDGQETNLSNVIEVTVPSGTNTNRIRINVLTAHLADTVAYAYIAPNNLNAGFPGQAFALVFVSTGLYDIEEYVPWLTYQAPDSTFDHMVEQAALEFHAGIWGGQVDVIGTGGGGVITLQFTGSAWTTNQLAGRIISLLGLITPGVAMPLFNAVIASNTSDVVTLDRSGSAAGYTPVVGDVFVIRTQANIATSTTIGDSLFINAGVGQAGTGLTPSIEVSRLVTIIGGTGAGQSRLISANTTTTLSVSPAWVTLPDATSIFVITSNGTQNSQATTPGALVQYAPPSLGYVQTIYDRLPIAQGVGNTYLVTLYAANADGELSLQQYSPYREIYLYDRWDYPSIVSNQVTLDLALSDNFEVTLPQSPQITILPPMWSGLQIPSGVSLTIYFYQPGTYGSGTGGGAPTPAFQTGAGGFGQDLQVSVNAAITISGAPGTRSVFQLTYHADGLWHVDNFQTGLPPG